MSTDCFPDSRPDWIKAPIGAISEVNPSYRARKGQSYPFVEMSSVAEHLGGIQRIEYRRLEGSGLARFKAGDTIFAKITPCVENGKVAYVPELTAPLGLGSTEFIVLAPREGTVPRFLFHLLGSDVLRGRAGARMEGSTGRQRVPEDVFRRWLLVPVPSTDEQAAIARILDAVDAAIERTREAVARARTLHSTLLADAFERLIGAHEPLGEYTSEVRYGTSQAASDRQRGYPTLRIPNVVGDRLALEDLVYVDLPPNEAERVELVDGDLLLVRTNGNPHYVGRSAVFRRPDDRCWVYASYLIRVRLNERLLPDYVNIYLGTQRGRRELLRRVTTSAGNHNINSDSIRLLRVPVLDQHSDQERIVRLAHLSRARLAAVQKKVDALVVLKKSLLHDLLTGKVRVPVTASQPPELAALR